MLTQTGHLFQGLLVRHVATISYIVYGNLTTAAGVVLFQNTKHIHFFIYYFS
jgi:hypothetical protein